MKKPSFRWTFFDRLTAAQQFAVRRLFCFGRAGKKTVRRFLQRHTVAKVFWTACHKAAINSGREANRRGYAGQTGKAGERPLPQKTAGKGLCYISARSSSILSFASASTAVPFGVSV